MEGNLVLPFLAMYRTWATPEEILTSLIARFSVPEPKGAPLEELKKFYMEVAQPIQLRVANVIKLWLTYYWYVMPHPLPHASRASWPLLVSSSHHASPRRFALLAFSDLVLGRILKRVVIC
jgi:hypothetical protein